MRRESACKPGSVEGNHSSGTRVAASLERPTRKRGRDTAAPVRALLPYLALLQVGFAVPSSVATDAVRSYRTVSPLPFRARRHGLGRFAFCCTFRGLAPPRRYLAPRPPEPGLSSIPAQVTGENSDCPADSHAHDIGRRARTQLCSSALLARHRSVARASRQPRRRAAASLNVRAASLLRARARKPRCASRPSTAQRAPPPFLAAAPSPEARRYDAGRARPRVAPAVALPRPPA